MRGDPDISDQEPVADVNKFLVTEGILRRGKSAGHPLMPCQGRITSSEEKGEHQDE